MPRLVVLSDKLPIAPFELGPGWVTIGRSEGNHWQLLEISVSGRHCEVKCQGEELLVRDLLSTNGVFINGKKVLEGTLYPGQTLRVGDVEMRFETAETPGTSFISKMLVMNSANAVPRAEAPPAPVPVAAAPTDPALSARKFQVLFVDDSLAFLESFGGVCAELGRDTWAVHSAASAETALQYLQNHKIHLVVLDIGMPLLDGLQLLGLIRRRLPEIKIAILTGKSTEARRADALKGGADIFLEKPLTPDGMRSVFNLLNDLVSWAPTVDTALLKERS
ncbi:MAG TPA: response regulator [Verrucomicrobiae bacterium]